ncbi:hypothetical protein [Burkholderia glumae]|uniref:hypothetical protein n=1 Tax=Burkholderia glumae TaxID=337 RepID=UPI0020CF1B22|nr:hypothetical protein [Burkholderia glumae]MCQ0032549.1 hypothetical protein [Burkholderia glumae]MCQ0035813.1 hypothetical protein [Burkholderia glumae]
MTSIDKDEALQLLGDDIRVIHDCIHDGWHDFQSDFSPAQRMKLSPRTQSNIVNDLIVERAKTAFDGHLAAECIDINQMFLVAFINGIAIRFKKLDSAFAASNNPTKQSNNFARQRNLPGIIKTVHLNAGYRLNEFATELEGIYLTCPRNKNDIYWWHELGDNADDAYGTNIVLPFPPAPPNESKPFKIIRRNDDKKDATD